MAHLKTEMDIVEDAVSENGDSELTEHFDVAIVFAEKDKETALDILDGMNAIELTNGSSPKVCLYTDITGAASQIAAGKEITKLCTLIFVLVTPNLDTSTVANLIKDEAIGNTRLAKKCHPDLKYCVRPVYIEPESEPPFGLSTIQSIDWFDRDSKFFKRNIKKLFEQHMHYRQKRERAMDCQNDARVGINHNNRSSDDNFVQKKDHAFLNNIDRLQPSVLQVPPATMEDNKGINYSVSTNSAQFHSVPSEQSAVSSHLGSSQANTLSNPQSVQSSHRSNNPPTTSDIYSVDSGRGASIGTSAMSARSPILRSVLERSSPADDTSERINEIQTVEELTQAGSHPDSRTQNTSQSTSSQSNSSSFEGRSGGFTADPHSGNSTGSDDRSEVQSGHTGRSSIITEETTQGEIADGLEVASMETSTNDQAISSTSREETDGSSVIESDLNGSDIVEDVSMRNENNSQDGKGTGCPSGISGQNSVCSQTCEMSLDSVVAAPSSGENGQDNEQTSRKYLEDKKRNGSTDVEDTDEGLVKTCYGEPHRGRHRCGAPNDQLFSGDEKVAPLPHVFHYHTHYHGGTMGPAAFPPLPGAPLPYTDLPGFQLPPEPARPITVANCGIVQIGANGTIIRGTQSERQTNNQGVDEEAFTGLTDHPPPYSVEDPRHVVDLPSLSDSIKPQDEESSLGPTLTRLKQLDTYSSQSCKDNKEMVPSAPLDFPSAAASSLSRTVTRDGPPSSSSSVTSSGDQLCYSRVVTAEETHPVISPTGLAETDTDDNRQDNVTDFSSLSVPELGSGDDLHTLFFSTTSEIQDQSEGSKTSQSVPLPLGRLLPCRLFCKHKRRQDMYIEIGRRILAAGGPCSGQEGHDSDLD